MRFMARATLPGGGLFGTVADLLAFGRALLVTADGNGTGVAADVPVTARRDDA